MGLDSSVACAGDLAGTYGAPRSYVLDRLLRPWGELSLLLLRLVSVYRAVKPDYLVKQLISSLLRLAVDRGCRCGAMLLARWTRF
jgi:hypothetical protein